MGPGSPPASRRGGRPAAAGISTLHGVVFAALRRAAAAPGRPARRNTTSIPGCKNILLFIISDLWHGSPHPGPARGALRDRHEMRAGVRWTRQRRRGDAVTGTDNPLSHARRGRHGDCHSGLVDRRRCAHRAPARRPGRPRTEKSCGPDARQAGVKPSGDAAARPGPCSIEPQGDGGNSASLPGESAKDTVKTNRAGKAGRPARPVVHPVCILCIRTRVPAGARPSLRPLAIIGRKTAAKLGRNAPRECECMSAPHKHRHRPASAQLRTRTGRSRIPRGAC